MDGITGDDAFLMNRIMYNGSRKYLAFYLSFPSYVSLSSLDRMRPLKTPPWLVIKSGNDCIMEHLK